MKPLVRRDIPLILSALRDAADWQDSLHDAHYRSLMPHNRTPDNTAYAHKAYRLRKRYMKLATRIRAANASALPPQRSGGRQQQIVGDS